MPEMAADQNGFTCECGARNEYPGYVKDHWGVRLVYSCSCSRRYILYRGSARRIPPEAPDFMDSESFGD